MAAGVVAALAATARAQTAPPAANAAAEPLRSDWTRVGGGGECVVLGPAALRLAAPWSQASTAAAGAYSVHFAADARGRPEPLAFDVPQGAAVQLATAPAAAATMWRLAPRDPVRRADAGELHWPGDEGGDRRLRVALGAASRVTLLERVRSDGERYALAFDAAARTVVLDRALGGAPLVLARAQLPAGFVPRTLELESHGFRLQAFVDGVRVLQVLDGAIGRGGVGVRWSGGALAEPGLEVAEPAAARPSVALVRTGLHAASVYAASAASPGPWAIVELALDRPHPLLLREPSGCEPSLLQRPAAPVVLVATPRQELGLGMFAETPPHGPARADLRWPALPALGGQCALVRFVYVAADGTAVLARSPAVLLRL
jgi:hypothetical protein